MQQFISQDLLPVVLAAIMLGIGLSLKITDFRCVAQQPKVALLGLLLQWGLLPALALIIIAALPLSPIGAAGLFLLSLCPGGVTSNLFCYLIQGNLALSVTLTSVVSLLSPLTLPVMFLAYLSLSGDDGVRFSMPLAVIIKQLVVVTLLPIALGMSVRYCFPNWADRVQPTIKRITTIAMIMVVIALMITNTQIVQQFVSLNALAALLLCISSFLLALLIARSITPDISIQRTLALEVGIQNAGVAIMVALSILNIPALAAMPLLYGLLMNGPAFLFVAWVQTQRPIMDES